MKLSSKTYDILKWIVLIFLPALGTAIFSLGAIFGFDTNAICGVISVVEVFIGSLIGVSTLNYNKDKDDTNS